MKAKESYETRLEMAHMHDSFIERLGCAMEGAKYVEASWLCYAIFEQRITRLILKHISQCPREEKKENSLPVSISTRIGCIKKLIDRKYGGYGLMDKNLFIEIEKWCKNRNRLVHGLVSLEHYKQYDKEFEELAKSGEPLVQHLYAEVGKFRNWYYDDGEFGEFPKIKCNCRQNRCVYEEK